MHFGLGQILGLWKWVCQIIPLKTKIVLKRFESDSLRSWETREGHRKSHGKSWNLKSSKGTNPVGSITNRCLGNEATVLPLLPPGCVSDMFYISV